MMKNVVFSMRVAIAVAIAIAMCAPVALGQSAFGPGTIAYVNESPEAVYVVSGTSEPRRLTTSSPDDRNGPLAWSADGRWLAFSDGGLILVDVTNGKSRRLTDDADTSPSWDNAGNLWFRRGGALHHMRLTGSPQPAGGTTCPNAPGGDVSPDGRRYVYSSGTEIRVCGTSAAIADSALVPGDDGVQKLGPRWSPDGRHVTYFTPAGEGDRGVFVVDRNGSPKEHIGSGAWPDWSLDSETLLFAENEQPSRLMLSDRDGSDRRPLSSGGENVRGSAPAWGRTFKQTTSGNPPSGTDAGSDESDNESGSSASDDDGEPARRQSGTVEADPRRTADPDAAAEDAEATKKRRAKEAKASPESFAAPETEGPSRLPLIAGLIAGLAMIGAGSGIGFWLLRRGGAG